MRRYVLAALASVVIIAVALVLTSGADLAMVNLETAVTGRGEPVAGKNYHFRSPAASFTALRAAGVDVVNMANNHALDYGPGGLTDTFDAIAASKLAVTGIGHDAAEAYKPFRTTIKGQRIAILSATDWLEPDLVASWSAADAHPGVAFSIDRSGVLLVTATGREVDDYSWVPARITNGVPVPETGDAATADVAEWANRRSCSGLSP